MAQEPAEVARSVLSLSFRRLCCSCHLYIYCSHYQQRTDCLLPGSLLLSTAAHRGSEGVLHSHVGGSRRLGRRLGLASLSKHQNPDSLLV